MSDEDINKFFVKNIKMLETIAKGIAYKNKKQYIQPTTAVNEAYLYIFEKCRNKFEDEDQLQRIVINFITKNIIWDNSSINKKERVMTSDYIPDVIDDFSESLDSKLEIEFWYNNKKCTLELYRNQEQDKVKQIIYDCYFKKGITKGVDLAKHLKINKDYACKYIREMKKDIREFQNKNNNI